MARNQNNGPAGTDGSTDDQQDQDLDLDADEDLDGDGTGGDGDGDDDSDDSVEAQVRRGIAAALPEIQRNFQSEMDRRINRVVKKLKPAARQADGDGDDDEDDEPPARQRSRTQRSQSRAGAPESDERGARVAFREYLPGQIKFLSEEERQGALRYGQLLILEESRKGFDDEDTVGRDVAQRVAEYVKGNRKFYSERTKRTLERQGALVKQEGNGGSGGGGTPPPTSVDSAWKAAEERRRKLFPHQFKDDKK